MANELEPIRQNIEIVVNDKGVDESTGELGKLNTKITESTTATANNTKEVKKSEEQFKSYKQQLKEAVLAQQKLTQQYGATSAQATEAAKKVAMISDEMQFQKDLVKSYNPDEKFRGLTQTAGLAALALGGVKDGLSAIGIESKTLDTLIGSAQAILGVTSAVAGITDAYEVLTAAKKAKTAAEVVEIGTTEALAVAEGEATVATWSFNAALLANPAVIIAASVVALGAAIYGVTKYMISHNDEVAKAEAINKAYLRSIEDETKGLKENSKYAKERQDYQISLMKARGDSSAIIEKETKRIDDQNVSKAKSNQLDTVKDLIDQRRRAVAFEGADEEKADIAKKAVKLLEDQLKDATEVYREAYNTRRQHSESFEIAKAQAETDAREKRAADLKSANEKAKAEEKAEAERVAKEKSEALKKADEEDVKRFDDRIKKGQKDTEDKDKEDADNLKRQQDAIAKLVAEDDAKADADTARDKRVADAKQENVDRLGAMSEQLIKNLANGAIKSKAIQKAAIIADGGISVGKAIANTSEAVTKDLAKGMPISAPLVALDLAVGATSVASIVKGTSQALKAVGGGSAPTGSVGGGGATPTRNVAQVGFQSSSENQISSAIAQQQKEQPPIQAFVVSQAVTDQQEADRKKQLKNSF